MSDRVPSFLLLVPGPWDSADPVIASLRSAGIEATPPTNDPFAAGAVEVSFVFDPQLGRNVAATGAALPELVGLRQGVVVEIGLRLDEDPAGLARLGHALRAAGGVAVRMERSGRSFAWEPWLERVSRGTVSDLYELGVMLVQDDAGFVFSVGMLHFDLPDCEIALGADIEQAAHWLHAFNLFQLTENPVLGSGHTFRPDADATRRTVERWPDGRHHPADGRSNPFGLWRFLEEGDVGVGPCGDVVSTFILPLAALLRAKETQLGRGLTRDEVEALRDGAVVMNLELSHARAMERSRGYADLEPERAWEQWQIVRRMQALP
ncbi:MAG: hypothetical protein R3B99_29465 [Polyangiales bacterium]|nr:hypothetical protein [Myxococcales bacterium]